MRTVFDIFQLREVSAYETYQLSLEVVLFE